MFHGEIKIFKWGINKSKQLKNLRTWTFIPKSDLDHGSPLGDLLPFTPFILVSLLLHSFLFLFLLFFLLLSWLSNKGTLTFLIFLARGNKIT